jgi:hypothetical protein
MTIQYIKPLSTSISRAKRNLFNPLDLKKWFVIGFTAFLAGLADVGVSSPPTSSFRRRSNIQIEDVLYFPQRAWEWLGNHPGWAIVIGIVAFLGFVIGIVLTWLSSRGKFMFLDNVVRGRAEVVKPWYEYREEGNSLFFWFFVLGLAVFAVSIAYFAYCFINLQQLYQGTRDVRALIIPAVLGGLGFFVISVAAAFIFLLLRDFVVPIMYRDRISASKGVQKFLPLFFSELLHFVGYGLFRLCLLLLVVFGIVLVGCATCCVGFLIFAIPYINAVLLLPISYAMRAFSVEFLQQFGREYDIFPKPDVHSAEAQSIMG